MLSLYAVLCVGIQLAIYPRLQRRLGTVVCLRTSLPGYFIVAAAAPAIANSAQNGTASSIVHALVALLVLIKAFANMAFPSASILINAS